MINDDLFFFLLPPLLLFFFNKFQIKFFLGKGSEDMTNGAVRSDRPLISAGVRFAVLLDPPETVTDWKAASSLKGEWGWYLMNILGYCLMVVFVGGTLVIWAMTYHCEKLNGPFDSF